MVFSGHIAKETAQQMGYTDAFDIKLIAGVVGEHNGSQYAVVSLSINSINSCFVIPLEYIDNIKYDAFDLQEAEKIKNLIYRQKENRYD